jgi:hypothetical protein
MDFYPARLNGDCLSLTPVLLCSLENCYLPILMPQFNVVSINVLLRLVLRRVIVSAPELKSARDAAVRSYNVGPVVLHCAPNNDVSHIKRRCILKRFKSWRPIKF